jgi:hypothetical protein
VVALRSNCPAQREFVRFRIIFLGPFRNGLRAWYRFNRHYTSPSASMLPTIASKFHGSSFDPEEGTAVICRPESFAERREQGVHRSVICRPAWFPPSRLCALTSRDAVTLAVILAHVAWLASRSSRSCDRFFHVAARSSRSCDRFSFRSPPKRGHIPKLKWLSLNG